MKKQILNLGKSLSKAEQKTILGGDGSIWSDKHSCKVHCRSLYGFDGVCCPSGGGWMCDDFNGTFGC